MAREYPMSRIFCTYCGKPLTPPAAFCDRCGRPVAPEKKPRKKSGAVIAIVLSAVLVLGAVLTVVLLLLNRDSVPGSTSPSMALGAEKHLASQTIKPSGGEIEIDDTGTVLDGMVLSVPGGAYDSNTKFEISMSEIKSHDLGELFHPATPLITIENGGGFANEPMTLKIPIEKDDDEFAMAFYYDTETGQLEGIPTVELTNDHITIVTCHFCDLAVTKEKPERITGTDLDEDFVIDSGFEPGRDDFQMRNYGSFVCPEGHCAGQSIGAMYYYLYHGRIGWDANLNGLFDNNGREATPLFDLDDAAAMRLCSVLQKYYETKWPTVTRFSGNTYLECAYAIQQTGQPQYLYIKRTDGAHALIAYKVAPDGIFIADPNYPGEERKIQYSNGAFNSYFSGSNYEEATTNSKEYKVKGYYGLFSLINKEDVGAAWETLRSGQDPGAGVFPDDPAFSASIGKDPGTGFSINAPLTDGMTVTEAQLLDAGQGGLLIYTTLGAGGMVAFYSGDTLLGTGKNEWADCTYPLQPGSNDIGILYMQKIGGEDEYVNFYRFTVYLQGEVTMSVSPDSATVFPGDPIPFTVTAAGAPADAVYLWDFGDGGYDDTSDTTCIYEYSEEGVYDGTVTLYSAASPDTPLAQSYFYVCVLAEEETASPAETSSPATSQTGYDMFTGQWFTRDNGSEVILNLSGDGTVSLYYQGLDMTMYGTYSVSSGGQAGADYTVNIDFTSVTYTDNGAEKTEAYNFTMPLYYSQGSLCLVNDEGETYIFTRF